MVTARPRTAIGPSCKLLNRPRSESVKTGGVMVVSYVRDRERIFLRWLENVERLDRGAAF